MKPPVKEPVKVPFVTAMVLYCDPFMGDEQAAVVTLVADPIVNLTVFPPHQPPILARAVPFNDTDKPVKGTWRWRPE